jgi:hypothetical protein
MWVIFHSVFVTSSLLSNRIFLFKTNFPEWAFKDPVLESVSLQIILSLVSANLAKRIFASTTLRVNLLSNFTPYLSLIIVSSSTSLALKL